MRFLNITLLMGIALTLILFSSGCKFDTTSTLIRSNNDPMTIHPDQSGFSNDPVLIHLNPRVFTMNTQQPVLQLSGDVCEIHVQSGKDSQIIAQVTIRHYQKNHMPTIQYHMSSGSDALRIDEKLPQAITNSETDSVIITMTVPQNVGLSLSNKVGNIGISSVQGQSVIATSTGSITADNVQLDGRSSLNTNVGTIKFFGNFASGGMYHMGTNVGSIHLTFRNQPSLHVVAQTVVGAIHSNFSSLNIVRNRAQGTLGNGQRSQLFLSTHVGSIDLME